MRASQLPLTKTSEKLSLLESTKPPGNVTVFVSVFALPLYCASNIDDVKWIVVPDCVNDPASVRTVLASPSCVPVPATALTGVDALLSIVQMPKGVPVGTLAIGKPGAANAGLLAADICANKRPELRERLRAYREKARQAVLNAKLD